MYWVQLILFLEFHHYYSWWILSFAPAGINPTYKGVHEGRPWLGQPSSPCPKICMEMAEDIPWGRRTRLVAKVGIDLEKILKHWIKSITESSERTCHSSSKLSRQYIYIGLICLCWNILYADSFCFVVLPYRSSFLRSAFGRVTVSRASSQHCIIISMQYM